MLDEERSIDTSPGSDDVDDTDEPTCSVRSGEDRDVNGREGDARGASTSRAGDGEGACRKPGRPGKLTAETQAIICAGIVAGMGAEHAAESAGVSASTYHSWINTGRGVAARGVDAEQLSDNEKRCLEFHWAVKDAKDESLAVVQGMVLDVARDHVVRKVGYSRKQLTNPHGLVCDNDGNPTWAESVWVTETSGPHVNALLAVMRQRAADVLVDRAPNSPVDANVPYGMDDATIQRLSQSIRISREELERQAAYDRGEQTGPEASPTTAVVPLTTDDDGDDYTYAAWVSSMYAEVAPETLETPETPQGVDPGV
jgi:hypothetical protein